MRLESAITIAQVDRDAAGPEIRAIVRHGEIKSAVAVKVPHCHRHGTLSVLVVHVRLESPIAITQQHAHNVTRNVRTICHGKVQLAVSVEISHRHRDGRSATGGVVHTCLEGAIAVP